MMKHVLTFAFILFSIIMAYSCSCSRAGIIRGQNKSDFVFSGNVIKINEVVTKEKMTGSSEIFDSKRYEFVFEINQVYKGKKAFDYTDSITLITSGMGADCGNWFDENQKYLVYAYMTDVKVGWGLYDQKEDNQFMTTHLCTRTKKIKLFSFLEQFLLLLI